MDRQKNYFIISVVLLSIVSVFVVFLYFRKPVDTGETKVMDFPVEFKNWRGRVTEADSDVIDVLETDKIFTARYFSSEGEQVWYTVVYSEGSRLSFHPPENCILGSGKNELLNKSVELVKINDTEDLSVNKFVFQIGKFKMLMYYWYLSGEKMTSNYYLQQAYFILDGLLNKKSKGALLRVYTIYEQDESAAEQRLNKFLSDSMPLIKEHTK